MKYFRGAAQWDSLLERPVVTIGNFDGVHLGHRQIVELTLEKASGCNGTAVVYTFAPHPQRVLHPEKKIVLLTTYSERANLVKGLGIPAFIEEPFSREFSSYTAQQFFTEVLLKRIQVKAIVVGYDFGFGKNRMGQLENLRKLCDQSGVELSIVPPHSENSKVISSSMIRKHLCEGEVSEASQLLGYPFFYRGVVQKGDQRGGKIGFPTANLKIPETKIELPNGVYATRTKYRDQTYPSVTNIGVRPTFQKEGEDISTVWVETHVIDQSIDLYGEEIEVQFVDWIRGEKKFSGVDELKAQIGRDVERARGVL